MTCTVIYYEENSKTPRIRGFSDIKSAKNWMDIMKETTYTDALNPQILVDYGQVEFYKEKFDEVYEIMKQKTFNVDNIGTDKVMI